MAEKWTKTSSPDWRWMNPNPLLALNHFTVPCSFNVFPSFNLGYLLFSTASRRKRKRAASVTCSPSKTNLKVIQEQQTQKQDTTECFRRQEKIAMNREAGMGRPSTAAHSQPHSTE